MSSFVEPERGMSALDRAQDLALVAFGLDSLRKQTAMARKAIQIHPDCADAYTLLAQHACTLEEAIEFYEKGVAAGKRAIGKKAFRQSIGHFWLILETRPFMRAMAGLVSCLWQIGRQEEAMRGLQEMLRLNPDDNMEMRHFLAFIYLEMERHEQLEELLDAYEQDDTADWLYAIALLAFRKEGDSKNARKALFDANNMNPYVPSYLIDVELLPQEEPESYSRGDEDEAIDYVIRCQSNWRATPGAIPWMRKTLDISAPRVKLPTLMPRRSMQWRLQKPLLEAFPLAEEEVWEMDVRPISIRLKGDDKEKFWILVLVSATRKQILCFELLESKPSNSKAWAYLTDVLLEPDDEHPYRPGTIRFRLKGLVTAWQAKLKEVGIECVVQRELECLEPFIEEIKDKARSNGVDWETDEPRGEDVSKTDLMQLPQDVDMVWQVDVRPFEAWIEIGGQIQRPWVSLVGQLGDTLILANDLSDELPDADSRWNILTKAMLEPMIGVPLRPGAVQVASRELQEMLGPLLEAVGVRCVVHDPLELIDHLMEELTDHIAGKQRPQAIAKEPDMTLEKTGSYYDAAAEFYRRAPWRHIESDTLIKIECDILEHETWYAVVMGQEGITTGLALYENFEELHRIMNQSSSESESARCISGLTVLFCEVHDISPLDMDAVEEHGWSIAAPDAYPHAIRIDPDYIFRTPLVREFKFIEGCLRAIPDFVSGKETSKTCRVRTANGEMTLRLTKCDDF